MADNEVSKIMWIGIVVALAAVIFVIANPLIKSNTSNSLDNVQNIINDTNTESNLLSETSWDKGQGNWTVGFDGAFEILEPESDKPNSKILHALPSKHQYQQLAQNPNPIHVNAGETYTISYDFKDKNLTKNISTMVLRVFPWERPEDAPSYDPNTGYVNGGSWVSQSNAVWYKTLNTSDIGLSGGTPEFKRVSYTFTVSESGWLNVIPYDSDNTGNHESFWRDIEVKKV